jgi:REP element-mobilizing transposase RayT
MVYYERQLPHWHPERAWLFVTWRLHGSLRVDKLKHVPPQEVFRGLDRVLDAASDGPVWLKDPRVASAVCQVIQDAESPRQLCKLSGFVVMSNHVHVLVRPMQPVAKVTHWIKGVSARNANRILNRTGEAFWQHESFDHWVRSSNEYERILNYIERNPVRAGLVTCQGTRPTQIVSLR